MEILTILLFIALSYFKTGETEVKRELVKLPVGKNTGNVFDETAFTEILTTLKENKKND